MRALLLILLAVSMGLTAWSLQQGQLRTISGFLAFYRPWSAAELALAAQVYALLHALTGLLALWALKSSRASKPLALCLALLAIPPLVTLAGPQAYIADLGGFPVLGAGQGIIKYLALLMLALTLLRWHKASARELFWLNYLPVALVLLWIGGMKFLPFEARGIVDLVASSPLLSWLYWVADEQQASNLIGLYDWLAFVLLGLGFRWRQLFWPGFLLSLAVFATTQSFLLSFAGAWSAPGVLSSSGVFIIKDLWFIANLLVLQNAWRQLAPGRRV